jgi:hypothetical protein
VIIEPFAGSAGYGLRYPDRDVILIERDPVVAALWRYLIGATSAEILALPDIEEGQRVADMGVCPGASALIGFWVNRGSCFPCQAPSAWMRDGRYPGSFWGPSVRARVASGVARISHWVILEGDYTDAPDIDATWFVDPPYQQAGKHYRHGSSDINYAHLAEWCRARQGQVIVCEQSGADWLPFGRPRSEKTTRKGKRSLEVEWCK